MQTLLYDLAYGLRVLLKTPRFTGAAVLSLAIGIGANTAIFSVPIGKRLERTDNEPWRTVVGVVRDTKEFSVDNEPPISIYHPHEQFPIGTMFLVVRSIQDASTLTSVITKEIRDLDPDCPHTSSKPWNSGFRMHYRADASPLFF